MDKYIVIGLCAVILLNFGKGSSNTCRYREEVEDGLCWVIFFGYFPCPWRTYSSDYIIACCPGWEGENCEEECGDGFYGYECGNECKCIEQQCNHVNGLCGIDDCGNCTGNKYCNQDFLCECMPGWKGNSCNESCDKGFYGEKCGQECNCTINGMCNNIDGQCICKSGWTGSICNTTCEVGFYGPNCTQPCNCSLSSVVECDPVTGVCECPPGLYGDRCQTICPEGLFGYNCSTACSCDDNEDCDSKTGACQNVIKQSNTLTESSTDSVTVGVGISAVVVFLICILIVVVLLWKRRNQKRRMPDLVEEREIFERPDFGNVSHSTSPQVQSNTIEQNVLYNEVDIENTGEFANGNKNQEARTISNAAINEGEYDMLQNDSQTRIDNQPENGNITQVKNPQSYEEPHQFPEYENLPQDNQQTKPTTQRNVTLAAGYSVPHIMPSKPDNMISSANSDPYYEETDISDQDHSDNYSKLNRNNIIQSDEVNDDYGKLLKSEFIESDEEYDTLGVKKQTRPANINGNTYSSLQTSN